MDANNAPIVEEIAAIYLVTFPACSCEIEVSVHQTVDPPVFVAQAYVRERGGEVLRPIVTARGSRLTSISRGDNDAMERMLSKLEICFGQPSTRPVMLGDIETIQTLGTPWTVPKALAE
jgi:hypothetical protein